MHHRVLQRQLRCRKLLAGLREALKLLDEERPGPEGDVLRMITKGPCSQPFSRMSSFFFKLNPPPVFTRRVWYLSQARKARPLALSAQS